MIRPASPVHKQPDGSLRTALVYGLGKENDPARLVAVASATLINGQLVAVRVGPVRIETVAPIDRDTDRRIEHNWGESGDQAVSCECLLWGR